MFLLVPRRRIHIYPYNIRCAYTSITTYRFWWVRIRNCVSSLFFHFFFIEFPAIRELILHSKLTDCYGLVFLSLTTAAYHHTHWLKQISHNSVASLPLVPQNTLGNNTKCNILKTAIKWQCSLASLWKVSDLVANLWYGFSPLSAKAYISGRHRGY